MSGAERLEQVREALVAILRDPERTARGPLTITRGQQELLAGALAALDGCVLLTEEEADFLLDFGKWPTEKAAQATLALLGDQP